VANFLCRLVGVVQPAIEPGLGVGPVPVGGSPRKSERLGGLLVGEAREATELDEVGLDRVFASQEVESVVDGQKVGGGM
jgi:hypothetical protein